MNRPSFNPNTTGASYIEQRHDLRREQVTHLTARQRAAGSLNGKKRILLSDGHTEIWVSKEMTEKQIQAVKSRYEKHMTL